jgi:signal transduction histidine kinase/CheY-like chemotaxis protein
LKYFSNRRFKPLDIALAVLFAGWVPSILLAVVSYSILTRELESKIVIDRSTLVKTLAHLIGYDLTRTGEVMEYYQTLPVTQAMLLRPANDPAVRDWLAEAFYSHPRIDGMFLADASGKLLQTIPAAPDAVGHDFASEKWIDGANATESSFLSPVHPRVSDQRLVTSVVVAIRSRTKEIVGYMGATVLVERIGRRIAGFNFGDHSVAQVFDQSGFPMFDNKFMANPTRQSPNETELLKTLRENQTGHFELRENFYSCNPIEPVNWIAVLEQPTAIAYAPLRELVSRISLLAGWLIVLTAVAAWLISRFYSNQIKSDENIARATLFNERILANMPVGIALVDSRTKKFIRANEFFLSLARKFGVSINEKEVTDLHFSDLPLGIEEMFEKVAQFGVPFQASEQSVTAADGVAHFLTINLLRLQDMNQKTQGILFLVEDNTADVTMRRDLIAANTAKDEFLALLSHELRNPLSPVITMVAELEEKVGDSPDAHRALEIIRRNVELEARLIDDLLDVTRITHHKLQLAFERVDAHQVIRRALEICEKDIESKHLDLVVELKAQRHFVQGDPARLQQVFWNIIKNSVKFTAAGSISVRSRDAENDQLIVEIADTGIGIEPDRIDKVFRAFEQGESSITRKFGGLGLGLAITKAMVDAHGGVLRASSEGKDRGALFTVELATLDGNHAAEAKAAAPIQEKLGTQERRILLVDDHLDTCTGMRMLLERRGYHVTTAHTVVSAVEIGTREPFDVVISDLGLPDGTGFDLMRQLLKIRPIPGIALSGFGMESDIENSREAGFVDHMIKPINISRLEEKLREILG